MVNQSFFFHKLCLIFKINCVEYETFKTITKLSNLGYHTLISEQNASKKIQIVKIFVLAGTNI